MLILYSLFQLLSYGLLYNFAPELMLTNAFSIRSLLEFKTYEYSLEPHALISFSLVSFAGFGEESGPVLIEEPPNRVDFSNSTGASLHCATRGRPSPSIVWRGGEDNNPVGDVPGLRKVRSEM